MPFIEHEQQPWIEIRPGVRWQFITGHFATDGEPIGPGLTTFYQVIQPGFGVPRHKHNYGHETMTLLEGDLEALVDGEVRHLAPGTTVLIPEGAVHSFRNESPSEVRLMFAFSANALRPEFLEDPMGVPAAY